jgi:arylsulfatase
LFKETATILKYTRATYIPVSAGVKALSKAGCLAASAAGVIAVVLLGASAAQAHYVYNFLGIEEQKLSSGTLAPGTYTFKVEFVRKHPGQHRESVGDTKLYVYGRERVAPEPVATLKDMKAQTGKFTLCGDGVGYDSADAISEDYKDKGSYPFQNGTIGRVVIKPEGPRELDHAVLLAGALSAD